MRFSDTLTRVLFALKKSIQFRAHLVRWKYSPSHNIVSLSQLTSKHLKMLDTRLLVLDFDGVMASHGELEPCEEILAWLQDIIKTCPALKIAILSNKPLLARQLFFSAHFPNIIFFVTTFKKPYPIGLEQLALQNGVPLSQVLLMDDRWLTGMLAAILAGAQGIYVQKPYANFRRRPLAEIFFAFLRVSERFFLALARY